ncbi:MAG TPA: phage tail sheath subtilisin-like domain-containing protein [Nevskia sp.]|nr:phage tail sheath subtilisin-like domain-containing protein [Nevskia sp.]
MLPFTKLPAGSQIRTPLFYAEVNNSKANTAVQAQRTLILGQMFTSGAKAGTATPGKPVICGGAAQAAQLAGAGSMLHLMAADYFDGDPFAEVHLLPLQDDGGAVAAIGSFAFTHIATANGVLSLYIGGTKISLPVLTTQTVNQLATALAAAVNATPNLPVSAAVDGTNAFQVNFTALNAGPGGNEIDLRVNYGGTKAGEATPAGLTFTIIAMASGATAPSLSTPLSNLGDKAFDFIVLPYTDSTSLDALKTFLDDNTGRWSWDEQVYGGCFAAYRGTYGALTTFGSGRNDQHACVMGIYDTPTPAWRWAAQQTAAVAPSLRNFAPQPLQTLAIADALAPPLSSRFPLSERNALLFNGISTFTVDDDGTVRVERLITTYQTNAFGQADNSYLPVERMYQLMFVLRFLKGIVTSEFGRMALADDGTRFAPGSPIVTPSIVRARLIAAYAELEFLGYVQDTDAFAEGLIVQRNAQDRNRLDVLWDGILTDQLNIFALLAMFRA